MHYFQGSWIKIYGWKKTAAVDNSESCELGKIRCYRTLRLVSLLTYCRGLIFCNLLYDVLQVTCQILEIKISSLEVIWTMS